LLPEVAIGMEVSVIGVPFGADTGNSLPTALSGIGIAATKLAKRAVPIKGGKKTIVENIKD